ncbi:peroxiredoxin family protein [Woeseia oceani]|uniref:Alkyl hydroperoxide reductase n=1 Tax=Woeseia oceani TaxID=1548547 RepID=A0A193LI57_9GAMM|nr:redoxin domain-containing protein [Woeseia oceani]ANO52123.1 alkyl hydroperoxide reductase [Woeseia oceani]
MYKAPELKVCAWLNTEAPVTLAELRGRVVVIEAFQMLCPGCVAHGLPQAKRVAETFRDEDVVVLGLHTVFEHVEVQGGRDALAAFMHEYRIPFPVAIDAPGEQGRLPETMSAYGMRGTPTLLLIDRAGLLRQQYFGAIDDMRLGAEIMSLLQHSTASTADRAAPDDGALDSPAACTEESCAAP